MSPNVWTRCGSSVGCCRCTEAHHALDALRAAVAEVHRCEDAVDDAHRELGRQLAACPNCNGHDDTQPCRPECGTGERLVERAESALARARKALRTAVAT